MPSFAERASKTQIKQVGLTRIEGIIAESGKHPNYFLKKKKIQDYEEIIFKGVRDIAKYFEELWVRTSDIRTDEFQNLEDAPKEKEANPMLGMHGIRFGIKNPEILNFYIIYPCRFTRNGTQSIAQEKLPLKSYVRYSSIRKEPSFSIWTSILTWGK